MNKPIKLTQEITDQNVLLNKFILYEHTSLRYFVLLYVYKLNKKRFHIYEITFDTYRNICISNHYTCTLQDINNDLRIARWLIYTF